ncbi:MAG: hypothetical protein E7302_11935 [Butyrivibrio sp.]|nr:hypothetical protein [Butyrivibrio sp.]
MVILSVCALIFWLFIIPMCMGQLVLNFLPITKRTAGINFLCGYLLSFAVFEVVAIPCMFKIQYGAFAHCVRIFYVLEIILSLIGVILTVRRVRKAIRNGYVPKYKEDFRGGRLKTFFCLTFQGEEKAEPAALISPRTDVRMMRYQYSIESIVFFCVFLAIVAFQLFMAVFMAPFDGDDAYYVVETLLAQQADVMNTILPYTGSSTPLQARHAMAVFTMWEAFIAKVSGVHATIVCHSVLPLVILPLVYIVYLEIGRILLGVKQELLPIFMIIIALFLMFGNTSIYTAETFLMMRTWQGKAMVANFIIPMILWIFLWLFEDCRKPGYLWKEETYGGTRVIRNSSWILLFMVNMAAGIMSSMGIMFGSGLVALFSFMLLVYTRDIKIIPKAALSVIPSIVYLLVYKTI